MTDAIGRLEELLDAKDTRIAELEEDLRDAEQRAEQDWAWTKHTEFKTDALAPSPWLPVPRLEIRWTKDEDGHGHNLRAAYSLVMRHFCDQIVFVPLGLTKCSGGTERRPVGHDGRLELPFRDGAHIHHDMLALNLPGWVVFEDVAEELKRVGPRERDR